MTETTAAKTELRIEKMLKIRAVMARPRPGRFCFSGVFRGWKDSTRRPPGSKLGRRERRLMKFLKVFVLPWFLSPFGL